MVFRKLLIEKFLKLLVGFKVNTIPELGLPVVQVVDAVEVKIFLVPSKHGFPRSYVDVRIGNPRYFLISQALTNSGIFCEIRTNLLTS